MRLASWIGASIACAVLVACKGSSSDAALQPFIADSLPAHATLRPGLNFDSKLELLGARLEPAANIEPGKRVELVMYWRKLAELDADYRQFTHLLDGAGERVSTLDQVGSLREAAKTDARLLPARWQIGKIYVDRQRFIVPSTIRSDELSIVTGFFRGHERLPVRTGRHDHDRGVVATVALAPKETSERLPQLWVPRRRGDQRIVIDGVLDEPVWLEAGSTGPFVDVLTGEVDEAAELGASAKLVYDADSLYMSFEVFDEDLRGGFDPSEQDPKLWTSDAIEILIDPDGNGDNLDYYELALNPQNLVFDSEFDSYRKPMQEPNGPYGHQTWSSGVQSAVKLRGTLDDASDVDQGYVVELSLPWSSLRRARRTPPTPGSMWRMNFFAVQKGSACAWSPVLGEGSFHRASRFGRVYISK